MSMLGDALGPEAWFTDFERHEIPTSRGLVHAVVGGSGLPRLYADVLDVWRPWADDVNGGPIDASHFLAEDNPEETAAQLLMFLGSG